MVLAEVSLLLAEELVAELDELSVVDVMVDRSVELEVPDVVPVLLPVEVADPVEVAEPVTTPVAVPVAPWMPKLVEKLMLVGSVSSMISMV